MREMKVRLDGVRERLLPPHLAYSIVCGDGRFVRFQSDAAVLMVLEVTGIDALNISPKFLAHALDRVATCIDEVAKRYRSVHRVRNDGTTITAVAGLFDSDEGLDAWAGQAIDFCSTCITQWRDTRTSPIRDVGLKIGLVCGPAFGGCLGDRPTFILGGPGIRLAEELVTFAQPGEILTEPTVAERLDTSLWRIAPSLIPPSRSSVRTLRVAPVGGLELSPVRGPGRHGLAPLAIPASLFDPPGAHDGPSSERGEGRPDRRNDPQFARRATLTSRLPPPPPRV
jgi:class 3 adenylate cyclase